MDVTMPNLKAREAWTEAEDELIRNYYPASKPSNFRDQHLPNRTIAAIQVRANRIGVKQLPAFHQADMWTESEDEIIRNLYPTTPAQEIHMSHLQHRTIQAIMKRANILGINQDMSFHFTRGKPETIAEIYKNCSEPEIAYFAGIVDGEGCIGYYAYGNARLRRPVIFVSNNSLPLMDWLQIKFGHLKSICRRRKQQSEGFQWSIYGNHRVRQMLAGILPFMIVKRTEAELLINNFPHTVEGCAWLRDELRKAKRHPDTLEKARDLVPVKH
jgi:hypothetical protein